MGHYCIAISTTLAFYIVLMAVPLSPPFRVYATPPSTPCKFSAIFNFGNSNSDTGGVAAAFGQVGPPHGVTYFHAPAGRYCDGRLIIDFISRSLGFSFLNAYLDSRVSNFSHGCNFAVAGSSIRPMTGTSCCPFSLNVQYRQFLYFQKRSQQMFYKKGYSHEDPLSREEYFSQALYMFNIGQNDLTSIDYRHMSPAQVEVAFQDIINRFKAVIEDLYDHGGRYFYIHNTGPLGFLPCVLVPFVTNSSHVDPIGCAIPLNNLAQTFNTVLKKAVAQLREELPQAVITHVDIYSAKYDLISHAKLFGFKNPLRACCGHGGGKYNYEKHKGCGATAMVKGKQVLISKSCKHPTVMINWDGAHYTEAANKWIFDRIVDGSYSDPPVSLNMACYKQP